MCRTVVALLVAGAFAALAAAPQFAVADPAPVDCVGPPGDAAPGTADWHARELREVRCGEERASDTASNPLFTAVGLQNVARDGGSLYEGDPFRDPSALNGVRFRYLK